MATNNEQIGVTETIVMDKPRKPLHVQIVSLGAFAMISITLIVLVDMFVGGVSLAIASSLGEVFSNQFSIYVRIGGLSVFGVTLLLGVLGKKLYAHRVGEYWKKIFIATICLAVSFYLGIVWGLFLAFGAFLWTPKLTANWSQIELKIYRYGAIIILGGWAVAEWIALPDILLSPFVTFTFGWYGLVAIAFIVPMYILLPIAIHGTWNLRPNIESFWREFLHHKMGMFGLIIIGTIVTIALLAPFIAPYHWGAGSLELDQLLQPPSPEHILGTNHRGEDIYSRMLYGSQISLIVGFTASVVSVFLGTAVGLISGYYGGILDSVLMRITDVFLCLPTLPLMLIFLLLFGQGLQNVIVVIAILGWTGTARMVRSEALSLRERPLTEAAHALGASDSYILFHHIMPNTLPLILANMILGVVNAILSEAGIAFLGFVDIHGQPSWGILLHWAWKNAALLSNRWWWFIPPGLLIMLTTLGFVFISHTADKVVNPRLRGRRQ
ncbi:MAG: ABC transporter permease [Candidatus Thorarchaeota archaeon]|nr:ABC transporter permease [Candidatus Thorarchaeota archaeon]